MSRLVQILDGLDAEIEGARAHAARVAAGSHGQSVPFHGDFAGATLSVLKRLAWWTRELRGAACEPCGCANRVLDARTETAAEARLRVTAEAAVTRDEFVARAVRAAERGLSIPPGWWGTRSEVHGPRGERVRRRGTYWAATTAGGARSRHWSRLYAIRAARGCGARKERAT